jgi:catechol 2,3-dioxygenase-like lactoylglutathione lyase family enzyme
MQGPIPDQFNLVVTDMDATVAFYRKLGLTIPDTDPQWQHHHRTATLPGRVSVSSARNRPKASWMGRSVTRNRTRSWSAAMI